MLVRESEDGGGKDQFSRDKTQPGHHATQTSKEKDEEKNKNDEKRKNTPKREKKGSNKIQDQLSYCDCFVCQTKC